jgi:hypothetical protein
MLDFNEGCQIGATTLGIMTTAITTLGKIAHIIMTLSLRTLHKHVEHNVI